MITRRSWLVYGVLLAIWIVLIGWQAAEHERVRVSAQAALRHRAEDISNTMALLIGARGFVMRQDRIENWLNELVKQGEVISIRILNGDGEKVAEAGIPFETPKGELLRSENWDEKAQTLTLINPVELPTNTIIAVAGDFPTNRPPRGFGPGGPGGPGGPPGGFGGPDGPPQTPQPEGSNAGNPPPSVPVSTVTPAATTNLASATNPPGTNGTNVAEGNRRNRGPRLTREELDALLRKRGAHGFVMVMSMQPVIAALQGDLWLRAIIVLLATVSVLGYGLAWGTAAKTSELQIRLVRASELNSHLKQMNLAAAGLAHETRNPLNIVRGLAQMISKQESTPAEVRIKAKEIIDESDRVAAQLNEFINYSRPREVRRAATRLGSVVAEVSRALNYDIEEKKVALLNKAEDLVIEADEQLLRQALFNLVLNAIQAAPLNGEIQIRTEKQNNTEICIEISDNGPGVAPEHRGEIFKPYFTTHEEGTGLGLAVVQQIILAHGWEIECLPNQPKGAKFRIAHVKLSMKS